MALEGDTGGQVKIQGTISATGYRYTTPPAAKPTTGTYADSVLFLEDLDADDLLQGGPAVAIAAIRSAISGVISGKVVSTACSTRA